MKLISWNVNGLRACITKGFEDFFKEVDADMFCIQETKMQEDQAEEIQYEGYYRYMNSAVKKGYSGTMVFTKQEPISVTYGLGIEEHDQEGRIITLEYDKFYLVCCYTPNSKRELERLDYRMIWEDEILKYFKKLEETKPVVYCGDLNVAHQEIDIKNPATNHHSAGFTDEERNKFSVLLSNGFIDTYRYMYPDKVEYSWWSYMRQAREKNIGWRIDYFVVSDALKQNIEDAKIHTSVLGSDHCPIELDIKI